MYDLGFHRQIYKKFSKGSGHQPSEVLL